MEPFGPTSNQLKDSIKRAQSQVERARELRELARLARARGEPGFHPVSVAAVDRQPDGVVVTFSDGVCAKYPVNFLYGQRNRHGNAVLSAAVVRPGAAESSKQPGGKGEHEPEEHPSTPETPPTTS